MNCLLQPAVRSLVIGLVNRTPDKSAGWGEAVDMVNDNWSQFEEAGATINDLDAINDFIRWAKWEGFCERHPFVGEPT